MSRSSFKEFCKHHIEGLEKQLSNMYTIDKPKDYLNENAGDRINVRTELEKLKATEDIYSVVETQGIAEGEVYNKYSEWLTGVRDAINILEKEKEVIDRDFAADITNAKLLMDKFEDYINNA
ncbi:hypothetical protein [Aquibacillus sediminis]|uniref:hypothetical protein n=1 Tax=Aquibacillus sediminis TaxID=2574734 RepID=UPI0011087E09|nr:hypothetical protein [Aquibacillus sediminis]